MRRTTHVSKEQKLLSLLERLQTFYYENDCDQLREFRKNQRMILKISRYNVETYIRQELEITDRHTIYGWIDKLISENYLAIYQISANHVKGETLYYIDIDMIEGRIREIYKKLFPPTLMNFTAQKSTIGEPQSKVDPPTHGIGSPVQTSTIALSRTVEDASPANSFSKSV